MAASMLKYSQIFCANKSKFSAVLDKYLLISNNNFRRDSSWNGFHVFGCDFHTCISVIRRRNNACYRRPTKKMENLSDSKEKSSDSPTESKFSPDNLFDEQYFAYDETCNIKNDNVNELDTRRSPNTNNAASPSVSVKSKKTAYKKQGAGTTNKTQSSSNEDKFNYFDDMYFGYSSINPSVSDNNMTANLQYPYINSDSKDESSKTDCVSSGIKNETKNCKFKDSVDSELVHNDICIEGESNFVRKFKNRIIPNLEEPKTAFDVAMKIRKSISQPKTSNQSVTSQESSKRKDQVTGEKLDSKGYRNLKGQVPNFTHVTSNIMTKIIKDSVIYNNGKYKEFERDNWKQNTPGIHMGDIVAIDKPYGIATHTGPGTQHNIGDMLPELTKLLFSESREQLQLLHRLDKECTGVMLLARSPETFSRIKQMFKDREIIKKYWVITKGVPSPHQGVIDIPMQEVLISKSTDQYRMGVIPEKVLNHKRTKKASEAITEYRVLDYNGTAAILECKPITGVKHQIRGHLAFGLNTPILGDHKYSHPTKLAPQRLHSDILLRLKIRQSKVRHVPMHLHAKSIVIPNILDGRNLFIRTNLPRHFSKNMKRLKLKPGIR